MCPGEGGGGRERGEGERVVERGRDKQSNSISFNSQKKKKTTHLIIIQSCFRDISVLSRQPPSVSSTRYQQDGCMITERGRRDQTKNFM